MALNRLETYEKLVDTYRVEIKGIEDNILFTDSEIMRLRQELSKAELRMAEYRLNRDDQLTQLRGIGAVITQMKLTDATRRIKAENDYD